jgi:hypothetical protein
MNDWYAARKSNAVPVTNTIQTISTPASCQQRRRRGRRMLSAKQQLEQARQGNREHGGSDPGTIDRVRLKDGRRPLKPPGIARAV